MSESKNIDSNPIGGDKGILSNEKIKGYMQELKGWEVIESEGINRLERIYKFKNFREALDFTIKVGNIAEEYNHHPVITTEWGKVKVTWWTHEINGLHKNDFVLAAKTDELYSPG